MTKDAPQREDFIKDTIGVIVALCVIILAVAGNVLWCWPLIVTCYSYWFGG